MQDVWKKIPQMHRTLLLEEFTHAASTDAKNLYDILSSPAYETDVERYKAVSDKLEVRSFGEFLEKFQPKVFEYTMGSVDSLPQIYYTIDPMEAKRHNAREIKLTEHTYYEMLVNMYNQKADSGVADIEFNDAKIKEILTPKREIEKLYDTRRQIPLLMERYNEKIKKNENASSVLKSMNKIRKDALEQISRPTSLMAIGLDDAKRQIEAIDKKLLPAKTGGADGDSSKALESGRGGFDENGRWILIPAKSSASDSDESSDSKSDPTGNSQEKFALIVRDDLNKRAPQESSFTKKLIIAAYTGVELDNPLEKKNAAELVVYREELIDRKNIMEALFKQAKESFIKALSENVQKLLSVQIFFEHATGSSNKDAKLPKGVGVIVANCTAAKLVGIKDKFESAMKHLSRVNDKNKIWFAVMPNVIEEDLGDEDGDEEDLDNSAFGDNVVDEGENKKHTGGTDFSAAKTILKIMDACKILTVFNFAPTEKTTFSAINADTIDELQEELEAVEYEHAVYALPNFTIMRSGSVPMNDEPDAPKIPVPAIYINASYVAAGLLVAAQQPEFWIKQGFKDGKNFTKRNPCVRVDFEAEEVTNALLTHFNRERSIDWSEDVINALSKNRFGFAFTGDRRFDRDNNLIKNTYILNARTLKKIDGKYQQIFRPLTKNFIETFLSTSLLTSDSLKKFLRETVADDWKREGGRTPDSINLVLREGEDIFLTDDELEVQFLGGKEKISVKVTERKEY